MLRVYPLFQERQATKIEPSFEESVARERKVLSDEQQQRFDQLFLQQETWLHSPAVLLSEATPLAPLRITQDQRKALEEFVNRWRSAVAKSASLAELIAKRQEGLQQALVLLDETQQEHWAKMTCASADWKLHFGASATPASR